MARNSGALQNCATAMWLVGCGLSTISAVDQVLTGILTLFQAARERICHEKKQRCDPGRIPPEQGMTATLISLYGSGSQMPN